MTENRIAVQYQAVLFGTRVPFRYVVGLGVNGIDTTVRMRVWGKKRALALMETVAHNGNQVLMDFGVHEAVYAALMNQRREIAVAKLKVGDKVRLWVDLGIYKKGRVCTVVEVEPPSFYTSRGENAYNEQRFPIKVIPTAMAGDPVLGPNDGIALAAGEFGPLNEEVPE